MSNFGHARERQVRKVLEEEGWWVARAAGSLGDADLVAAKAGTVPRMIEVKATARSPWHGFPPEKRSAIRRAAEKAGFTPDLAYWPKRKALQWIPESQWP